MHVNWRVFAAAAIFGATGLVAGIARPAVRAEQPQAPGAAPAGSQQRATTFRTTADYVEVDVYVTDKQGRFVRDLRQDQFRVFESGQPQEIATLQFVDLPLATAGLPPEARAERLPVEPSARPAPDPAVSPGRMYFIALDDLHTRPEGSPQVRIIANQFIERCVTPADRASVVFTSGRQDAAGELTGSATALKDVVKRFVGHKVTSPSVMMFSGNPIPATRPSAAPPDAVASSIESDDSVPGDEERLSQARAALDTLARLVEYAGTFHGRRKTIVFVSEGMDVDVRRSRMRDLRDQISGLSIAANRASVTIYAIDPRGISQGGQHAVEVNGGTGESPSTDPLRGALPGASQASIQDELRVSQEGLQMLAEPTGGTAFVNTSNLDRVYRQLDEASSTYYLLSYRSSTPTDGRFHPVDVRISVPGVTVRARKGFVKSPVKSSSGAAAPWSAQEPEMPAPLSVPIEPVPAVPLVPLADPASVPTPAPPPPAYGPALAPGGGMDDVVHRARQYVVAYGTDLSLVVGVEQYRQWVRNSDTATIGDDHPWSRETVSEFALVRIKDDWLGYRDVFRVDGKTLSDRQDRLQQLFLKNPSTAVDQGRRIADESARYNAGALQRNFNIPTLALFFLHPSNVDRFRFELSGADMLDDIPVWKVRYQETRTPALIRTSSGRDMPVNGTFWIDPLTGRVLKTAMEITAEARLSGVDDRTARGRGQMVPDNGRRVETFSRVTTSYRYDVRLDLLLPSEMIEEYQGVSVSKVTGADRITRINCRATYSDFKRFNTAGRVVVAK